MELIKINDLINILEKLYPTTLKEEWDNVGLSVGDGSGKVGQAIACLDVTDKIIENAIENDIKLIIAHHPLIYKPIDAVNNKSIIGKKIIKLIRNDIALYIMHTNADSAKGGLNEFIVNKLSVEKMKVLDIKVEDTVKIAFYVPVENEDVVREKLLEVNRFSNGRYEKVSYSVEVEESFCPKEGAEPFIGKTGEMNFVKGKRIEVIAYRKDIKTIINSVKKVHPYEEPAFEVSEIKNTFATGGIGRYFELKEEINISEYAKLIKEKLDIKNVRAIYAEDKTVKKIGLVNGSGASYIRGMKSAGVELFITGDVKYHEALDAVESGMAVIDIGHFEAEKWFGEMVRSALKEVIEIRVLNDEPVFKYM